MSTSELDAHERPPLAIRDVYKRFQKMSTAELEKATDLIDLKSAEQLCKEGRLTRVADVCAETIEAVYRKFLNQRQADNLSFLSSFETFVYAIPELPGLLLYRNLLPAVVQERFLNLHFHRDLSNPTHQTNVHLHYDMSYPDEKDGSCSFFDMSASHMSFTPKNPQIHKPISRDQFLNKKLRWMTLGGQYDWTRKEYPDGKPPDFPPDCKDALEGMFSLKAEAAIVNLYSPGDTLSLHRDVSEHCSRPLASLSIGCDAVFTIGLGTDEDCRVATIRIRSGDALLMCDQSRFAWHGVPRVLAGTCPEWLRCWPDQQDSNEHAKYADWRGWMAGKRVNINVRQMME